MKTRLNVLKKEAEQICLWGEAILSKDQLNYLTISKDGNFTFWVWGGSQDQLSDEEEYKNYEWRLTDINYLERGDVCKVIYNYLPKLHLYVFDKITEHYIDIGDEDYENKTCALMWGIEDNRPVKDYPFENVYKLFKKGESLLENCQVMIDSIPRIKIPEAIYKIEC
jgi:hypothetical protein